MCQTVDMKQAVTLSLDSQLLAALDGVAATGKASRSEALERLLGLAIEEKSRRKQAEQKVTLSVRVSPDVVTKLTAIATARAISKNQAAEYVIDTGLTALLDAESGAAIEALLTRLEAINRQAQVDYQAQTHRLAHLISRNVLEAISTRELMVSFLQAVLKTDPTPLSDAAWTTAVSKLSNPSPKIRETMRELLEVVNKDASKQQ